jgi:hypothetical protein
MTVSSSQSDLLVLQYPLRTSARPYEGLSNVQFKSGKCELEQTYDLDCLGTNYDRSAVEFKVKQLKLVSSSFPEVSQYCMLSTAGEQLTLAPLKGVLRLKPSFEHVDAELASRSLKPEVEETPKETYRSRKRAKVQPKAEEIEPWVELAITESRAIEDDLVPGVTQPPQAALEPQVTGDKGRLEAILDLPVSLQVEEALKRLHVTSAAELSDILGVAEEALLQHLPQKATLLQDRWVYRSELLYSAESQHKADLRDLVLVRLGSSAVKKAEYVVFRLHSATGVAYDALHQVLTALADLTSGSWVLKEPPLDLQVPAKLKQESVKYWKMRAKR